MLNTIQDKDFFRQRLRHGSSDIAENVEKRTVLKALERAKALPESISTKSLNN